VAGEAPGSWRTLMDSERLWCWLQAPPCGQMRHPQRHQVLRMVDEDGLRGAAGLLPIAGRGHLARASTPCRLALGQVPRRGGAYTRATMFSRHLHRCLTAIVVALAMLTSPLALARHRCVGASDAAMMAAMMKAGVPCPGMDRADPARCQPGPTDTMAAFQEFRLPVAFLTVLVHVLELPPATTSDGAEAIPVAATAEAQPPPDPLFLSTLRLRV